MGCAKVGMRNGYGVAGEVVTFINVNVKNMWRAIILVGFGGGIGSIFRFGTSLLIEKYYPTLFPVATLIVNIVGCFLIGLLFGFLAKSQSVSPDMKWFLITGFCGGFTTFSAFSYENFELMHNHNYIFPMTNIALNVVGGLLAVMLGLTIAR